MTRLCILGNSHVAALATGWHLVAERFPDVHVTFFAAPRDQLNELDVSGGVLVAKPALGDRLAKMSGGRTFVDPADYDLFWVCGLGLGIRQASSILAHFGPESMGTQAHQTPISDACFIAALVGGFQKTNTFKLVEKLRLITDAPISVLPTPMPSTDALGGDDPRLSLVRGLGPDDSQALSVLFHRAGDLATDGQVDFRFQPGQTLARPLFSESRFSRGSTRLTTRLDAAHPENDFQHMNADFGAAVFESRFA